MEKYTVQKGSSPLLVAHRGICTANIPCNTLAAFGIALQQKADVVEIDVSISKDGEYFVFHPGMENVYLKCGKMISEMTAKEVEGLFLLNQDEAPTHYKVPYLRDVLALLKDKAYINVDKFWTDVPGIAAEIRRAGVESQVIVKTGVEEAFLQKVEQYASDLMFMPLVRKTDTVTATMKDRKINFIGTEILFDSEEDEVISDAYIAKMHEMGYFIWVNSIVYNEKDVISAYHTDDSALTMSPDHGWGWLIDKKVDFIQTDWLLPLRAYMESRNK